MTRTSYRLNLVAASLLIVSTLPLTSALAAKGHRGGNHRGGDGAGFQGRDGDMGRALERLDLSEAQRLEADALLAKQKGTIGPLMEATRAARKELRAAADAEPVNESAIRTAADALARAEADAAIAGAAARRELRSILTPEQQAKLDEMKSERKERRGDRRERRRDRRDGGSRDEAGSEDSDSTL